MVRRETHRKPINGTGSSGRSTDNEHLRPYFMITLSHCERGNRALVDKQEILKRVTSAFDCVSVIVAKGSHTQRESFHHHVVVHANDSSRYSFIGIVRKIQNGRAHLEMVFRERV